MSKLNLDELIQQKLNQLEVPHKPEYWSQMEEELDTAAPIGIGGIGSSLTKIYTISGIATSVVVISIIGYFAFKNHSEKINDSKMLTTMVANESRVVNEVITPDGNQAKRYQQLSEKSIDADSKAEISTSTKQPHRILDKGTNTIAATSKINKTINNSKEDIISKEESITSTQAQIERAPSSIIEADQIEIDDCNNLVNYSPRNIIKNRCPKSIGHSNSTTVCNDLRVIKPINKPSKNVFKRRKGLLYRFGIRK